MKIASYRRFIVSALALALCLAALDANAKDAKVERARSLFRDGQVFYRAGKFGDALKKFQGALAVVPRATILLNIAQCYRQLKNPSKAVFYYNYYLTKWGQEHPNRKPPFETEVRTRIAELKKAAAAFEQSEAERKRREAEQKGRAAEQRRLEAERRARDAASRERDAQRAQRRLERQRQRDAARHAAELKRKEREQQATSKERGEFAARLRQTRESKTRWGWASLSVGIACAVGAGVMYGVGVSQGDSAYAKYKAAGPKSDSEPLSDADRKTMIDEWAKVESAKTKVTVGHVLAASAVVGVAIGMYSLLTRPTVLEHAQLDRGRLALVPVASPDGFSLALTGGF